MCASCGYPGDSHIAFGVAYPADTMDGHSEFMTADTVQKAATSFRKTGQIGLHHADGTVGVGEVLESYIYRGPDWTTEGIDGQQQVIKSGDWLLGVQFDAPSWQKIRSGQVTGWSIQGIARRRRPTPGVTL